MTDDYRHVDAAKRYDACLVALEAFTLAGLQDEERTAQRAAMLHAYATRIGALIAAEDPARESALILAATGRISVAVEIVRLLRS